MKAVLVSLTRAKDFKKANLERAFYSPHSSGMAILKFPIGVKPGQLLSIFI